VYRPDGSVLTSADVSGEQANPLPAIDELARTLFVAQLRGPGARLAGVAAVTTESSTALRAYLEGERHLRGGRRVAAAEAFARAVAADSTFALGWFRLSYATYARGEQTDEVRQAAEQALRYRDRLPERERRLLDPWVASARGLAAQALEGYRAYLGTYPDDITAWFDLGDIELHYGPLFGRTGAAAREAFVRVLAIEPDAVETLAHLSWVARAEGNHGEADSLVERLAVSLGGDLGLFEQAQLGFSRGDVEAQQRVLEQLRRADHLELAIAAAAGLSLGDLDAAETLARVATEPSRSAQLRAWGHVTIAHFKLARGQRAAAEAKLGDAARLDAAVALEYRALLSALPFVPVERDDLDEIRRELERWDAVVPATPAPNPWLTPHEGLHRHLRAYLLGVLNARLGDGANAARYADSLDAMPSPLHAASLATNLAHSVRAHIAWVQERPADALAALEQIRVELTFPYMHTSAFTNHVLERFLRAEALNVLGRHEEALRWYQSVGLWTHSESGLPFVAPSHLRRAEIYERLGDNAQAVEHYTRFLDLWKDADPELQPTVRDVKQRLAKLVGER
jgi:tetratricopeptide (TPR) repeat protein